MMVRARGVGTSRASSRERGVRSLHRDVGQGASAHDELALARHAVAARLDEHLSALLRDLVQLALAGDDHDALVAEREQAILDALGELGAADGDGAAGAELERPPRLD